MWEEPNLDKRLEKFNDKNLHQEFWDMYRIITPDSLLSTIDYFVIYTDDYAGDETASVNISPDNPAMFDLYVDPVDMIPSNIKIDKQYFLSTMIHENAHLISLNPRWGDGDSLSIEEITKQNLLKKKGKQT